MTSFEAATAVVPMGPGQYSWTVPDGWQQGRGAWGGLVAGALLKSVIATEPDAQRTVRSVSAQMMAPAVVGSYRIAVLPARIGSALSTWTATVLDDEGGAVASMAAILGSPRTSDASHRHSEWGVGAPPAAPAVADVPRVPSRPPFPVFTQHLEVRPATGLPLSGTPAESVGWIAYAAPTPATAPSLLALVDGWWPASLARLSSMPRIATVNFTANLLLDPSDVNEGQPLLHHSFVTAAHDGFTSEHRRLWTTDGRLVVDNMQTIVVGS